jgi:hypothetical protein
MRAVKRSVLKGFKSGITSSLEFRAFAERGKKYEQKLCCEPTRDYEVCFTVHVQQTSFMKRPELLKTGGSSFADTVEASPGKRVCDNFYSIHR